MSMLGVSMKPKMNCDFAFRRLSEAKNELRFAFPRLREAKNELRFAFPEPRKAKNELRFCFPESPKAQNELRFGFTECPETQKRIAIWLHGVSGDAKTNRNWASPGDSETRKELRYPCNASLKLGR